MDGFVNILRSYRSLHRLPKSSTYRDTREAACGPPASRHGRTCVVTLSLAALACQLAFIPVPVGLVAMTTIDSTHAQKQYSEHRYAYCKHAHALFWACCVHTQCSQRVVCKTSTLVVCLWQCWICWAKHASDIIHLNLTFAVWIIIIMRFINVCEQLNIQTCVTFILNVGYRQPWERRSKEQWTMFTLSWIGLHANCQSINQNFQMAYIITELH